MAARSLWRIAAVMVFVWLTFVVSMPSPARAAGVPIEGKLLVSGWDQSGAPLGYIMDGASDAVVTPQTVFGNGESLPDTTKVAYDVRTTSDLFHANTGEIWVANLDGTGAVNLTGPAGLGGVNCIAAWSPDGRTIAFQHAAPAVGQVTCEAGFQVWLMAADGTNLRQWMPQATYTTWFPSWAPDGSRLLCDDGSGGCVAADVTGANVSILPGPDHQDARWSRDGSALLYSTQQSDTVSGESGVWRQLVLANADGSHPQVLVQQFLKDSDIEAHIAKYNFQPADHPWLSDIRNMVGPQRPQWSPLGDQIAFVAALPFDPSGPMCWYQREVWLYDLNTGQLTRLTYDENWDNWLSWAGPNTTSTHPAVTVDNTSVTFSEVDKEGWTSIIREEAFPAALGPDQVAVEPFFHVQTTAQVSGPITVAMTYDDTEIPAAAEAHLSLFVYDPEARSYFSKPSTVDPANNVVTAQIDSYPWLGDLGLMWSLPASDFSDVISSTSDPYWALWEIEAICAAGIVKGYADGTYKPTDPVTRDQMAVYISRALAKGDANVPTGPATATFSDVATDHWAFRYVEYAVSSNVVKGYTDTIYSPADPVDRGQMAVFIARAKGWVKLTDALDTAAQLFPDVPAGFWSGVAIKACLDNGVVKGYDDGTYQPAREVTRDQMAVYVARAFELPM